MANSGFIIILSRNDWAVSKFLLLVAFSWFEGEQEMKNIETERIMSFFSLIDLWLLS